MGGHAIPDVCFFVFLVNCLYLAGAWELIHAAAALSNASNAWRRNGDVRAIGQRCRSDGIITPVNS